MYVHVVTHVSTYVQYTYVLLYLLICGPPVPLLSAVTHYLQVCGLKGSR
jgi:hypothetical protein